MKFESLSALLGRTEGPVKAAEVRPEGMTREARLRRWAEIVSLCPRPLTLFHGLEHFSIFQLKEIEVRTISISALTLAVSDPRLNAAGLPPSASIYDVMQFFGLTQQQLHEFSCDCGGEIDSNEMANRITRLV